MQNVSDIEKSVAGLPPEGLAAFRAWFEAFDAGVWDKQLEQDIAAGKLDRLAMQAMHDLEQGRCRDL